MRGRAALPLFLLCLCVFATSIQAQEESVKTQLCSVTSIARDRLEDLLVQELQSQGPDSETVLEIVTHIQSFPPQGVPGPGFYRGLSSNALRVIYSDWQLGILRRDILNLDQAILALGSEIDVAATQGKHDKLAPLLRARASLRQERENLYNQKQNIEGLANERPLSGKYSDITDNYPKFFWAHDLPISDDQHPLLKALIDYDRARKTVEINSGLDSLLAEEFPMRLRARHNDNAVGELSWERYNAILESIRASFNKRILEHEKTKQRNLRRQAETPLQRRAARRQAIEQAYRQSIAHEREMKERRIHQVRRNAEAALRREERDGQIAQDGRERDRKRLVDSLLQRRWGRLVDQVIREGGMPLIPNDMVKLAIPPDVLGAMSAYNISASQVNAKVSQIEGAPSPSQWGALDKLLREFLVDENYGRVLIYLLADESQLP